MHRTVLSALLILSVTNINAQNHAPIKVEKFPATPIVRSSPTDKASSSLVAQMMPFVAPIVANTREVTSTLVLANASTEATTATVTLFSVDGKTSESQKLTLAPHEKKEVPISSPGENIDENSRWGSVTVEQDPHSTGVVVAGQVVITDQRASTPAYIDEELSMPEMEGSTSLTAVTDESEGPPLVGITSISNSLQHVSIICLRGANNPIVARIAVAAHATAITQACTNASSPALTDYISSIEAGSAEGVYGIKLDGDGVPGSFAAFALASHYREHDLIFSAVPFYDPGMIHSSDLVFAGVPIGAQETLPSGVYIPRLSIANFSENPLKYSIQLDDTVTSPVTAADGTKEPPQVNELSSGVVPPHQTREYVFSGQEAQSGLLHSVVLSTDAAPGTYQAKLVSRSTGILYQVELLAKEAREMNNAGVHPWTIQGDTESHIVLFNHSNNDAKVGLFISAGRSIVWSKELELAPLETREVSINELQRDQVPDDHGGRIPTSAKEGVADWRTPNSGEVTGRLMVTSHEKAMARNFSCGTYYGVCDFYLYTYYTDIAVGGVLPMYGAEAEYCNFNPNAPNTCVNGSPTSGQAGYYWTVGSTNIITLNSSSQQHSTEPSLLGVSPGGGTATVEVTAGSCTSIGSGKPTVTSCSTPTGETTQYIRQTLTGSVSPTASDFIQTLQVSSGPGSQENGATVSESEGAAGNDSCWWSASPYPAFTAVTGGAWTVGGITAGFAESQSVTPGSGQWGPDEVGFSPGPVKWYQQNRPKAGLSLPCGATLYQGVSLTCPSKSPVIYATDTITTIIDSTGITNCRAGVCGAHYAYQ